MLIALASSLWLLIASVDAVGATSHSSLTIAIVSGLGAAVLTLVGQLLFRKQTKDKLIAEASDELIGGAKALLSEYREELKTAKEELARLRERVAALESELAIAKDQRDRIERERRSAIEELAKVQQRVDQLEQKLSILQEVEDRSAARRRRRSSTSDE